jgi:probable HAF family extracellular repeat protein
MGMRDLGSFGGSSGYSQAYGINAAGQVAGESLPAPGGARHAFITGPNGAGMMDLNSLVDVPEGVILSQAAGINNSGQVVAIGVIPEPETSALFLAGLPLVAFVARRRKMEVRVSSLGWTCTGQITSRMRYRPLRLDPKNCLQVIAYFLGFPPKTLL